LSTLHTLGYEAQYAYAVYAAALELSVSLITSTAHPFWLFRELLTHGGLKTL
jgi:hypothetical protein